MRKYLVLVVGFIATLLLATSLTTASTASAEPTSAQIAVAPTPTVPQGVHPSYAIGSTPIQSFSYSNGGVTVTIPFGCFFTHVINGGGLYVSSSQGSVDSAGLCAAYLSAGHRFCNWRIDFNWYDSNGNLYYSQGDSTHGCNLSPGRTAAFPSVVIVKPGLGCADLIVNGARRARQCHSIHA